MKNNYKPIITITERPGVKGEWIATLTWEGIPKDVKDGQWSICMSNKSILERYKKAVEDGKIYTNPRIVKGGGMVHEGKLVPKFKMVKWDGFVMGKYLNSDLKKLGY